MKHHVRAVAIALLAISTPATAQSDLQPGFDKRLLQLAPAQHKAESCFLRRYDAAHLKAHPKQRVETIGMCVTVDRMEPEEKGDPVRYIYNFDFAAKLKGRAGVLTTGGECGFSHMPLEEQKRISSKPIWCGVDCDGGGITVEPRKDGAELLVRLERIRVASECGGADDKVFLVPKASTDAYKTFVGK